MDNKSALSSVVLVDSIESTAGRESTLGPLAFLRFNVLGIKAVLSFLKSLISGSADMMAEELIAAGGAGGSSFKPVDDPAVGVAEKVTGACDM